MSVSLSGNLYCFTLLTPVHNSQTSVCTFAFAKENTTDSTTLGKRKISSDSITEQQSRAGFQKTPRVYYSAVVAAIVFPISFAPFIDGSDGLLFFSSRQMFAPLAFNVFSLFLFISPPENRTHSTHGGRFHTVFDFSCRNGVTLAFLSFFGTFTLFLLWVFSRLTSFPPTNSR